MTQRNKSYWFRLTVVGIIFALIILEILVRVFIRETFYNPALVDAINLNYNPNFLVHGVHVPNQELTWQYADEPPHTIRINNWGYRGADFTLEKPENTLRIMTLGGSAGFDATTAHDWPNALGDYLDTNSIGADIETINASVSGYSTYQSSGRLRYEAWMFEPDYVLVYHCWNDLKTFGVLSENHSLLQYNNFEIPRVWTAYQQSHFVDEIDRFLGNSHLYLMLRAIRLDPNVGQEGYIPPSAIKDTLNDVAVEQYRLNVQGIVDFNQSIGAQTVLVPQARLVDANNTEEERNHINYNYARLTHETLLEAFDACDNAMRAIAADNEDVYLVENGATDVPRDVDNFQDHIHLTPTGSHALAEAVGTALNEIILVGQG